MSRFHGIWVALLVLLLAACSSAPEPPADPVLVPTPLPEAESPTPEPPSAAGEEQAAPTPLPGNIDEVVFTVDNEEYVIRPMLSKDSIMPIYDPQFTSPDAANLSPDELVMGVAINGDARAYPVGVLRTREMVNDTVGGTPVLVTW